VDESDIKIQGAKPKTKQQIRRADTMKYKQNFVGKLIC